MTDSINQVGGTNATSGINDIDDNANLADLVFAVMIERGNLIEEEVKGQIKDIKNKNDELDKMNSAMKQLRRLNKGDKIDPDLVTYLASIGVSVSVDEITGTIASDPKDIISDVQEVASSLSSTSQLDMANLQSMMGKYNNTYDAMSNFINKYGQSLGTIINNLR